MLLSFEHLPGLHVPLKSLLTFAKETFTFSWETWLLVIASTIGIGLTLAAIYKVSVRVRLPTLVQDAEKSVSSFVLDSLSMLAQHEHPPDFRTKKCSITSGI